MDLALFSFILVVLVLLLLACYGVSLLPAITPLFKNLLMVLLIGLAILAIAQRSGIF